MEFKQIKELISAMEKGGIRKLTIKEKDGYELHLERQEETASFHYQPPMTVVQPKEVAAHSTALMHSQQQAKEDQPKKEGRYVTSPMVGTFYSSPSPDDPPFVKVGDRVEENSVICIVEAMKVMNEVKAGMGGTIAEVLLDNAHPVEYGAKLFRIV